jgi:hypothetical protein
MRNAPFLLSFIEHNQKDRAVRRTARQLIRVIRRPEFLKRSIVFDGVCSVEMNIDENGYAHNLREPFNLFSSATAEVSVGIWTYYDRHSRALPICGFCFASHFPAVKFLSSGEHKGIRDQSCRRHPDT